MNRFRQKRDYFHFLKKVRLSLVLFIGLFFLFLKGIGSVSNTTKEKQLESLNDAINRSVIHCYCVEGTYPPSLPIWKNITVLCMTKKLSLQTMLLTALILCRTLQLLKNKEFFDESAKRK